jgi:ubiquinol-cytochrome c reductase cytochrome c subunit
MRRRLLIPAVLLTVLAPSAGAASVENGKHLYGQYCVACHGPGGSGISGSATAQIGQAPLRGPSQQSGMGPPLRDVGELAADFYLRAGYMPLSNVHEQPRRSRVELTDSQIRDLVAYIGSLGNGPPIPRPQPERGNLSEGLKLFTDHCAGCHQVAAQGGYVTGAIPPPLGDATPVQIAQAVRIGPYVMPRFSKNTISDRQLDSIIAYVQYLKNPDDRGGIPLGRIGPVPEGIVAWLVAGAALVLVCMIIGKRLGSHA